MTHTKALSPVAGTVWKIEKKPDDSVKEGEEIMILESMKMEIAVLAPATGTISEISVTEGDIVDENQPVATIDPIG